MKAAAWPLVLVLLAAAAAAQSPPAPTPMPPQIIGPSDIRPVVAPPIIGPSDIRIRAIAPCLGRVPADVGTGGTEHDVGADVIGEKVIGEKVIGEKVIGEKVIGESAAGAASASFGDRWQPGSPRSFRHDLIGPYGDYRIELYGCSSSLAGETVTVRVLDHAGAPIGGWTERLIALPAGAARGATITLPKGAASVRLPLLISVGPAANAGTSGYYRLTVTRAAAQAGK